MWLHALLPTAVGVAVARSFLQRRLWLAMLLPLAPIPVALVWIYTAPATSEAELEALFRFVISLVAIGGWTLGLFAGSGWVLVLRRVAAQP